MPNTPLAYNPTQATIYGTQNFGTLCVGTGVLDYSSKPGDLTWWLGPEETTGYVIAYPIPAGNRSTPQGAIGNVGFVRSGLTDSAYIATAQKLTGQTFASATAARTYLIANNYWTNYLDTDAQTFITAAAITDNRQKVAINNLVTNLKSLSLWNKFTAVYPIVGGNATAHSKNLINPSIYPIGFTSGWNHTSEGMYIATSPSSGYADTGIAIGLDPAADNHVSVYCATDSDSFGSGITLLGAWDGYDSDGSVTTFQTNIDITGTKGYTLNGDYWNNSGPNIQVGVSYNTSYGHFLNTTTGNRALLKSYVNGVLYSNSSGQVGSSTGNTLLIGNINGLYGVSPYNTTKTFSFVTAGASLSDTDALNLSKTIEKFQITLSRGKSPITVSDPDLMAFLVRVYNAGGTLSRTELTSLSYLVTYLKNNGLWTKLSAVYPMVGGTAASCAQNLISSSFTGTFSSGWTFDYTGAKPNGTSAYMDTGFNFLTHGIDDNSGAFGVYLNTSRASSSSAGHGAIFGAGNPASYILPYAGSMFAGINSSFGGQSIASSDSLGFFQTSRISATAQILFKNSTGSTLGGNAYARNNYNLYVGAVNIAGPTYYDSAKVASAYVTKYALSSTDLSNMYTGFQTFNTIAARQTGQPIFADLDVTAFFTRVYAAGGTAVGFEAVAVNALALELKAKGLWTKMKAVYPFVGTSSASASQNLISSSYTGTFSGTWTYPAGAKSGGGYFNTGFIPNTDASINGVSFGGVFSGSPSYGNPEQTFGVYTGSSFGNHMYFRIYTQYDNYQKQLVIGGSSSSGQGLTNSSLYGGSYTYVFRRTSSTFAQAYYSNYGGAATSLGTITASTLSLPTNAFYFGALNSNGSAQSPLTDFTNAITFLGLDLTDQQAKDLNTAMFNYRYLTNR